MGPNDCDGVERLEYQDRQEGIEQLDKELLKIHEGASAQESADIRMARKVPDGAECRETRRSPTSQEGAPPRVQGDSEWTGRVRAYFNPRSAGGG